MKKIRWGIIGPGKIAEKFADALVATDNSLLHAVASRKLSKAKDFSSKFGVPKSYGNYGEMLEDKEVDAVYISTPHNLHFENAKACLLAGKHVLCEKPFTVTFREAEELFIISRNKNIFIMEALWTRFLPVYKRVAEWLEAGEAGNLKLLSSSFGFESHKDYHHRLFEPALAGGALLDIGSYNVAISQWVLRKNPAKICADSFIGDTGVDERTSVIMSYDGGEVSQFTCSMEAQLPNDFTIYGTKGSIRMHPCFNSTTKATLSLKKREVTITEAFRRNGFEYQIDEAARCICEGHIESPLMPHNDTLGNMKTIDSIRRMIGLRFPFEA